MGTIFKGRVQEEEKNPLKVRPIGSPETSVLNQPKLRNNPENGRINWSEYIKKY